MTFTENLLHVRHNAKHSTGITSFQLHKNLMGWVILLAMYQSNISHLRHMNCSWNVKWFSHLPKVTGPASDRAEIDLLDITLVVYDNFFAFQSTECSRPPLLFPVQALKLVFIQGGMVLFSWKFYLENTIWV